MRYRPFAVAIAALAVMPLAACSNDEADTVADGDAATVASRSLADVIDSSEDLSKFAGALEKTGLAGVFEGPAAYTVLAPDDQAVEKLGETGDRLMQEDRLPILAAILRKNILPGTVMPQDIKAQLEKTDGEPVSIATMGSNAMTFSLENGRIVATTGEGWKGVLSDSAVRATNGVVIPVTSVVEDAANAES